jgi:curved DNA-binding protein
MTYYTTLGLDPSASGDEIRQAYRSLSKIHHPDAGGDAERFKAISQAYQVLKDPVTRARYDAELAGPTSRSYQQGGFDDLSELFRNMMNIQRTASVTVYLTPRELFNGVTGYQLKHANGTVSVDIPAGMREFSSVRYSQLINVNEKDTIDVVIRLRVKPAPRWKFNNDDVLHLVDITSIDAIIGKTIKVDHLNGRQYEVQISPGTQNGTLLRLSGLGLKRQSDQMPAGDLFVQVNIVTPQVTDPETINQLKEIQRRL